MNQQTWNAQQYQDNASFVSEFGSSVLELLNPQSNETILDLGCGDGALTEKIALVAKDVIGIDSSESMILAAQKRGLNTIVMSGDAISYKNKFDAVFTNAALHWIPNYQAVIEGVYDTLKPRGKFVGEFGGHGNIATLIGAMKSVVNQNPKMGSFKNPWFFPRTEEYKKHLEKSGFVVDYIELINRPTSLKTGVKEWLKIFANHIISGIPPELEEEFITQIEVMLKPYLFSKEKGWVADYVRLRFHAIKA